MSQYEAVYFGAAWKKPAEFYFSRRQPSIPEIDYPDSAAFASRALTMPNPLLRDVGGSPKVPPFCITPFLGWLSWSTAKPILF